MKVEKKPSILGGERETAEGAVLLETSEPPTRAGIRGQKNRGTAHPRKRGAKGKTHKKRERL